MENDIIQQKFGIPKAQLETALIGYAEKCIREGYVQTKNCLYDLLGSSQSRDAVELLSGMNMDKLYNHYHDEYGSGGAGPCRVGVQKLEELCNSGNLTIEKQNQIAESIKIIHGPVWVSGALT